MRSPYWKARGYAYKLDPQNSGDLVHQAYLTWWKKTQKNLLLEKPETIASVIKYLWKANYRATKLRLGDSHKGPINYTIVNIPIGEDGFMPVSDSDPISEVIFNDTKDRLLRIINQTQGQVLRLIISGYTQVEIADEMGVSPQMINSRVNKIREKFHGKDSQYR